MKIHEYQGKALLQEVRRAGAVRHRRLPAAEASRRVKVLAEGGEPGVRRQGADPRRRSRQGRRRQGVQGHRRGQAEADPQDRHDPGDPPDRPEGKKVQPPARRGGLDIARELYTRHAPRPQQAVAWRSWRRPRAAWRSRRSPRSTRRRSSSIAIDPATGFRPSRAASWPRQLGLTGDLGQAGSQRSCVTLYAAYDEPRTAPARDQPARRHQGRPACSALDAKINFDDNALYRHKEYRGAARPRRGGREGDRGLEVRPQLHRARRQHRLHGQRRRAGDGDHGHHQATTAASRPISSTSAAAPPPRR